ncbi:hypothetical protein AGR1A_pAt20306 [Agrobacterium fabacearum CFBP 5771]|nr:hypothetical protein AGR1A_pAt20306 [Agrobacterium fabacearum CFBP 5771]
MEYESMSHVVPGSPFSHFLPIVPQEAYSERIPSSTASRTVVILSCGTDLMRNWSFTSRKAYSFCSSNVERNSFFCHWMGLSAVEEFRELFVCATDGVAKAIDVAKAKAMWMSDINFTRAIVFLRVERLQTQARHLEMVFCAQNE